MLKFIGISGNYSNVRGFTLEITSFFFFFFFFLYNRSISYTLYSRNKNKNMLKLGREQNTVRDIQYDR